MPDTAHDPPSPAGVAVGVVVPYDMALDRELWRWTPDGVSLLFTRTAYEPLRVTTELVTHLADPTVVLHAAAGLRAVEPAALAYACTSGSFALGLEGERRLVAALRATGPAVAVTSSGAVLQALEHLGVSRVAIATPYDGPITDLLVAFLAQAGIDVVGAAHLGLSAGIWTVPYARTRALVREADRPDAEAVVVSCTNLPTYDVIADLEDELGKPVVTANQATAWAVLGALGHEAVGPGQRLCERSPARTVRTTCSGHSPHPVSTA